MTVLSLIAYKQFPIYYICTMCIFNKLAFMMVNAYKERKAKLKEALGEEDIPIEDDDEEDDDDEKPDMPKQKVPLNIFLLGKIRKIPSKLLTIKGMIFTILVIVIIAIIGYSNIIGQSYVDKKSYPVEASKWIKENIDVEKMKLYNDFNYGSYLLFQDIPVFIDGRADVYDPQFNGKKEDSFLAYMLSSSMQTWYEDVMLEYDITHIITTYSSNLNTIITKTENEKYEKLYDDGVFVIYEVKYTDDDKKAYQDEKKH